MHEFDEQFILTMVNKLEELAIKHRERTARAVKENGPRNGWIRKEAVEIYSEGDIECWIARHPAWDEMEATKAMDLPMPMALRQVGYNGYACFKQKPLIEPGCKGIAQYVPVHGGITYAVHDEIGSVYGFDSGHPNSVEYPIRDLDWIRKNILLMILGIQKAAELEHDYLADEDNQHRLKIVQPLLELSEEVNMQILVSLMTGQL